MYNTILFDLDGTLTDPGVGITNSVAYALKKWNIEVPDRSELYKFIGPPLQESFAAYYGLSEEDSWKSVEYFREYFREKGIFENEVYPGIEELLKSLKAAGKTVIVATSKPRDFAVQILEHFHLDRYFDVIAGASMDETRVKKAEIIEDGLAAAGITDLSSVVMIGDREHDVLGAKQMGVDSIGVLFGYGSREELTAAGATYIAETVEDILKLLDLSDNQLFESVYFQNLDLVESFADEESALSQISPARRTVYILSIYDMEIQNGGLCQFFVNASSLAPYVEECLGTVGAEEHLRLFSEFITKNGIDVRDLRSFMISDIEEYIEQTKRYDFDSFDNRYYELNALEKFIVDYIRANIEEF